MMKYEFSNTFIAVLGISVMGVGLCIEYGMAGGLFTTGLFMVVASVVRELN